MSHNNGFIDNSGSNPVHGVDRIESSRGTEVYRTGGLHQAMASQGSVTTVENLGGVIRATTQSAKDSAMSQSDAEFQAKMNALPGGYEQQQRKVYSSSAGPNPVFGDLAPRSASGFYQQELTLDSIVTLPGVGSTGRVKDLLASGLMGKTVAGDYVLNYNPRDYDPNYGMQHVESQPQQQPVQQYQPETIADPVDHVSNILEGMGVNGFITLKNMERKYGRELLEALDSVSKGDSSKIIGLIARGI